MSMAEPSHWFGGHNSWLTFCRCSSSTSGSINTILAVHYCTKYCGFRFQFQKINSILAKLLIVNKTAESIPPTLAQPNDWLWRIDIWDVGFENTATSIDSHMASTLTCYLLIRLTLWIYDYLNTKFLNINSTGLTYLNSLTMDKTNIYLQFSNFTTGWLYKSILGYNLWQPLRTFMYVDNLFQVELP